MARKIEHIYNALIAEKNSFSSLTELQPQVDDAQTLLSDINSSSKVADWRLWLWLVAFAHHLHEAFMDLFRKEIDAKVAGAKSHTLRWYQIQAMAFQYGYDLTFNEEILVYQYEVDDVDSRIVTRAAVEESTGTVVLKVAKETGALSTNELNAFNAYMSQIKDAGTDLLIISTTADQFKVTLEVFYDPLLLNPDGSLILDSATFPVQDALQGYVQQLPFNGAFNINTLIDALQSAEGVADPALSEVQLKSAISPYAVVQREYLPYAGHYAWDEANSVITYTPANV